MIQLMIPGKPVVQSRPRGRIQASGGKAFVQFYDAPRAREWKQNAALVMTSACDAKPLLGPVSLSVTFVWPKPKSKPAKDYPQWHSKRPDIDNALKALMDAATGILWADDSQVCELHATAIVSAGDHCGVYVTAQARGPMSAITYGNQQGSDPYITILEPQAPPVKAKEPISGDLSANGTLWP